MVASSRTTRALHALAALVAAGWSVYAVHAIFGVGEGPAFDQWLYDGLMLAAGFGCLLRAFLVKTERLAWALFGGGILLWAGGEVYWSLFLAGLDEVPIPSPADVLYLALYPAFYVALAQLARARFGQVGRRTGLDGVTAALAVAALAVGAAFGPIFGATEGDALSVATNLAYPLGDVLLLGVVVGMTALAGRRPGRSWLLLAGGLVLMAVADSAYVLQTINGTYVEGGLVDLMWPTAALLLAAAAWSPPQPVRHRAAGRRVSAMPVVCALAAVATSILASLAEFNLPAQILSAVALVAVAGRMAIAVSDNQRLLDRTRHDALSDALTDLGNRRLLLSDLDKTMAVATPEDPWVLALFDLNGFKRYNDTYGHPAGDQLLARLGQRLAEAIGSHGRAYRLGGDEFCVMGRMAPPQSDAVIDECLAALEESGEGFSVDAARGMVTVPLDAQDASGALQLADSRMYAHKRGGRGMADADTCQALVAAVSEGRPELEWHLQEVAELASAVALDLGMSAEERDEVRRAAELHDLGKIAIPDAILNKPGPLNPEEWEFMRRHTLVGERILSATPALAPVGRLVRSSHEKIDGSGYPDGLARDEIPLGARVVAVCDAYNAMTSDRPYREAMSPDAAVAELRRCAGTQFDSNVVAKFIAVLRRTEAEEGDGSGPRLGRSLEREAKRRAAVTKRS